MHPCALMRWKPPFIHLSSTSLDQLSLESPLTIDIYHFSWAGKQNKGKVTAHISTRLSPNRLTHTLPPSLYLVIIACQGKWHAATRHSASLRATGETFPLRCAKYFLCRLTLFLLRYFHDKRGRGRIF